MVPSYTGKFAFPCSVEQGVDENKYKEELRTRGLNSSAAVVLDSNIFSVGADHTKMRKDYDLIVADHNCSEFCTQNDLTKISSLKTQLEGLDGSCADTFFVLGHAIDQSCAQHFSEIDLSLDENGKFSNKWDFAVDSKTVRNNAIGESVVNVFKTAQEGHLVVFSNGLLSPKWLVERIRVRDMNINSQGRKSSVLVVLDSCYSGTWVEYCRTAFENEKLKCTTFAIQASCSSTEPSYGNCFIPTFLKHQEDHNANSSSSERQDDKLPDNQLIQRPNFFTTGDSAQIMCKSRAWKLMNVDDFANYVQAEVSACRDRVAGSAATIIRKLLQYQMDTA